MYALASKSASCLESGEERKRGLGVTLKEFLPE
jgi:hypothetical protein